MRGYAYYSAPPHFCLTLSCLVVFFFSCAAAMAFPPAPHYTLYGIVRDQVGQTVTAEGAEVVLLRGSAEIGRIVVKEGWPMKTALREIAEIHTGDFRLTPSQNLSISGVTAEQKPHIEAILAKHGLDKESDRSGLRLNALSCVALPTCGLALAESERALPETLEKFEAVLDENGLRHDAISIRITGCPNGCARPYLGEIGFVGKAPNKYALYLGARYDGTRLNRLFSPSTTIDGAVEMLRPIIKRYALERQSGEGFGDFCDRVILPADATFHSVGTPVAA